MEHLMTPTLPIHGSNATSLLSRLKVLEILGLSCSDSCMTRCYEQLTNLKTLRLSASAVYFNKKLYRNLIPTNSNEGVYLPSLTTLIIGFVSGVEVRDMVARRRDAGVQLKVVYMPSKDQMKEDDTSWLVGNLHKFGIFKPISMREIYA
ncbi:hypothetical protein SERLA73DRAFT_184087 [Serpula lacrymans var. lacrymans S7.3]|uniref:Uncharacterized protein n=2 Tax=Serpula lacrymans var. lacrymans TaxID=341189 RepID=F8Q2I1_SERL3|nr:uncharacterized protein SERLADRAFT_471581 [Serpula lacrymans var. lacrymans S7.9]EGN97392.1 hypothetical protein SERLA73DRAFT_184087 [Serpula lacrymans var. lacrymans S7.3]EGO22983.1 hypothetical protein SERLADRAFT_471581 [Serpula lacrymans var. lacrymans S7.9]